MGTSAGDGRRDLRVADPSVECPVRNHRPQSVRRHLSATYLPMRREAYIDGWWSAARKAAGSSWKSSRQPLPQNQ